MAHTHPLLEAVFPRRATTLGDQIASLTHDVAQLSRQVRRHATPRLQEAAHSASDFAGDVFHQLEPIARDVAHRAAHQAKVAGRVVRDDPVPAVVALGVAALVVSLLLRRE
jgi:ElaB/YqjD/DUF883 family membrane-anchored ribosome-binding protein